MRRFLIPSLAALCLVAFVWAQNTRVGPLPSADSLAINQRVGRTGETITLAAGGENKERVRRGACYWSSDNGTGAAPGTALGTTALLSVYNPANSGTLVIIKRVYCVYLSGTLGTGVLYHLASGSTTQAAPSGGTALAITPALVNNALANVAQVRMGSTVVVGQVFAPFMYLAPQLATTVTAPQQNFEDFGDGIQLLPGVSYQLQAVAAAGTSPKMSPGVFWEEAPLLNGQP